jgi:hypothetical protein
MSHLPRPKTSVLVHGRPVVVSALAGKSKGMYTPERRQGGGASGWVQFKHKRGFDVSGRQWPDGWTTGNGRKRRRGGAMDRGDLQPALPPGLRHDMAYVVRPKNYGPVSGLLKKAGWHTAADMAHAVGLGPVKGPGEARASGLGRRKRSKATGRFVTRSR